jgi:hypothetical protein
MDLLNGSPKSVSPIPVLHGAQEQIPQGRLSAAQVTAHRDQGQSRPSFEGLKDSAKNLVCERAGRLR